VLVLAVLLRFGEGTLTAGTDWLMPGSFHYM